MLEFVKSNRKYILGIILFGLGGIVIVPIVMFTIKLSKQYPKVFKGILAVLFALICIYYIYDFICKDQLNSTFIPIMLSFIAIGNFLKTDCK